MDIADGFGKSQEKHIHQSPCDGTVDNRMSGEFANSPTRKRTQTFEGMKLPTRKSARLTEKNA